MKQLGAETRKVITETSMEPALESDTGKAAGMLSQRAFLGSAPLREEALTCRPQFRWSDLWRAPVHDFPIRDEILFQFAPLAGCQDILEIGPGCGFTAFRVAGKLRRLALVETSESALQVLKHDLRGMANIEFIQFDMSQPELTEPLRGRFDALFALDVFEYISDSAACLKNAVTALRPGGVLFLSYPNQPPPAGDGVTWFTDLAQLHQLLSAAGFRRWDIFAIKLRPYAALVYTIFHEWPLRLYRRMQRRGTASRPQTYEATWAFCNRSRFERYKTWIHAYWAFLSLLLRAGGNVFSAQAAASNPIGQQLTIRAWR
jgi:SAM-dependent methyltransferase